MAEPPFLNELTRRLGELLPGKPPTEELEKSVKSVVQSVFSRLELVTREEFDAQQAVLQRTRQRVQDLEAQLNEMTKQLDTLEQ